MKSSEQLRSRTAASTERRHEKPGVAILIVDMISDFDFPDGEALFENALPAAKQIAGLKSRAKGAIPAIYVNDNYGNWKHDFAATLKAARSSPLGQQIASILAPSAEDYHILKPQRSGFFGTPLNVLLGVLNVSKLIITGITTDICVMFTAHDAYMRGFTVQVPSNCAASVRSDDHRGALALLSRIADADIRRGTDIDLQNELHKVAV